MHFSWKTCTIIKYERGKSVCGAFVPLRLFFFFEKQTYFGLADAQVQLTLTM